MPTFETGSKQLLIAMFVNNMFVFSVFQAMARDPKNYYQDTPKQIKRKIALFKQMPEQYNKYLEDKKQKEDNQMS